MFKLSSRESSCIFLMSKDITLTFHLQLDNCQCHLEVVGGGEKDGGGRGRKKGEGGGGGREGEEGGREGEEGKERKGGGGREGEEGKGRKGGERRRGFYFFLVHKY